MNASRAFSLRQSARALVTPAPGHLRPLDGWRALSILWVVTFHVGWFSPAQLTTDAYVRLLFAPWMRIVWRGDFGVDVFFVLSGLLIAGMLVDERRSTGRVRLGLFYVRRALRLWPALCAAVVVNVLVIGDHTENVWANLFYVSNFLPVLATAMGWTWSLSIEEQFYLVCPWIIALLERRGRAGKVAIFALLFSSMAGLCALVVATFHFHAADSEVVVNRPLWLWAVAFDFLYDKPWMRAGPLLAGVAAAYLVRVPGVLEGLARRRAAATAGLLAAAGMALLATSWPVAAAAPRPLEVLYLALYRPVFGAAVAYLIVLTLSQHPVGRALGRVLSSRALYPFAQLAYSAYLLNPIMAQLVQRPLGPLVRDGGPRAMAVLIPAEHAATFFAAAVVYLLVERPFMELRPRSSPASVEAGAPA